MVARLRLARVLAYREKYDDALKMLKVDKPGKFAGRVNEVRGDVEAARGNVEEARKAYLEAMVADGLGAARSQFRADEAQRFAGRRCRATRCLAASGDVGTAGRRRAARRRPPKRERARDAALLVEVAARDAGSRRVRGRLLRQQRKARAAREARRFQVDARCPSRLEPKGRRRLGTAAARAAARERWRAGSTQARTTAT